MDSATVKKTNYKKKTITFRIKVEYVLDYDEFKSHLNDWSDEEGKLAIWEKMCKTSKRFVESDDVADTEDNELFIDLIHDTIGNAEGDIEDEKQKK